jgi:hypothetical protein
MFQLQIKAVALVEAATQFCVELLILLTLALVAAGATAHKGDLIGESDQSAARFESPIWSRDAAQIAFVVTETGRSSDWNIYVANPDGSGRRQLTRPRKGQRHFGKVKRPQAARYKPSSRRNQWSSGESTVNVTFAVDLGAVLGPASQ